ncbi:MAG TPA: response regulator [Desulfobacteraceae bacterium]|nr:response regulator [Desulfobacteraceae bacterium]
MEALNKLGVSKEQTPPHILVMEDDASLAKGLEMVLTEEGYDVYLAGTGGLALEAFKQKRYDLLVADLRLPDMDGMDVIRKVRAEKPDTGVVVITGYGTAARAVEAMKTGAHDFLPKPFTEEQIKAAVDDALRARTTHKQEPFSEVDGEKARLIQKREVLDVLNRTAEDRGFWRDLMENGSAALEGYQLSGRAKAAVISGDLKWINENVGELTQKQLMFIHNRLEREAW